MVTASLAKKTKDNMSDDVGRRQQILEMKIRREALRAHEARKQWQKCKAQQEAIRIKNSSNTALHKWREHFDMKRKPQEALRLPDRTLGVRLYSQLDENVWEKEELRNWFNNYTTVLPQPSHDPDMKGYMVRYSI